MIAVVLILGLLMTLVVPGLGRLSGRHLTAAAESLAAALELARQRTVMTGVPHRLYLDLDARSWRLEHWVSDEEEQGAPPAEPEALDLEGSKTLDLAPPREALRSFRALPGRLGRDELLEDSLVFAGVRTDDGTASSGEAAVEFSADGSTAWTEIWLDDESGHRKTIEVLPLAESVRVVDAEP